MTRTTAARPRPRAGSAQARTSADVISTASTVETPRGMRMDMASGCTAARERRPHDRGEQAERQQRDFDPVRHREPTTKQHGAEDGRARHGRPARPADELHPLAEGRGDDRSRQERERGRRPCERAHEQREQDDGGDDPLLSTRQPRWRPALRRPARRSFRSGAARAYHASARRARRIEVRPQDVGEVQLE